MAAKIETPFARRVLQLVARVPAGRVTTYGDLANRAGAPGAARAVGQVLRQASRPGLPYHRVIAANGQIGGYGGHEGMKAALLASEGLKIRRRRIVGFEEVRFTWK